MVKEVLLIFKTHLDIGFTDYSENIVNDYINEYIPMAISLGYELKGTDTPFIWTAGSWIIDKALKTDGGRLEQAIKDGIISWHGLPFTTHTELMNKELFEYGISISKKLDERFGVKTISAKLTDVPGHTVGMIEPLADSGIEFLHIGVNPATPVPKVPPLFRWKYKGKSVVVMYQADYGEFAEFDGFVIGFAHTGDNHGPQGVDDIRKLYCEISKKYPGAEIKAATLNDAAERICALPDIPVFEKEIGDTWIHGAATDPAKLSLYRELLRYIKTNKLQNVDLSDSLLMVPEHTWGMDTKLYLPDTDHYLNEDFKKIISGDMCKKIALSWDEQRNYVYEAYKKLNLTPEYDVSCQDFADYTEVASESINFEISWQLFDTSDYIRYRDNYVRSEEEWAIRDFTKVGLPEYRGGIFYAQCLKTFKNYNKTIYVLSFGSAGEEYGLPQFTVELSDNCYTVKWHNKKPSRLPQAFWFKFKGMHEKWEINKMSEWIKPEDIADSKLICAFEDGVRNRDLTILSYDCALAAPYGKHLLEYNIDVTGQDMHFNLYNNIWNTNFPMWYSDDAVFRFKIVER